MGAVNVGRFLTDTETTFGTTGAGGYRDQRLMGPADLSGLKRNQGPDTSVNTYLHDRQPHRHLSRFGSVMKVPLYLDGLAEGLVTASVYTHPQNNIAEVLKALLGGVTGAAGSTVAAGGGAANPAITVAAGHGPRFAKGGGAMINGAFREIANVVGDVVTFKHLFPANPGDGATVFNAVTLYPNPLGFGGNGNTLMAQVLGEDPEDQWVVRGMAGTFAIDSGLDKFLSMTWDVMAATWTRTNGITLGEPTWVGGGPLPVVSGGTHLFRAGSTTIYEVPSDSWSFEAGLVCHPAKGLGGVETVLRYRQLRAAPKMGFKFPVYEGLTGAGVAGNSDWEDIWDLFDSRQVFHGQQQIGVAPIVGGVGTGVVVITVPSAFCDETPKLEAGGEVKEASVSIAGRNDQAITSPSTDPTTEAYWRERAPFRIHLL